MAQFAVDTFTGTSGTELSTYSANWVKPSYSGSSNWVISDANRARCEGANSTYYNTGAPASADYTVKVDVYIASDAAATPGVCGRLDTSAQTYYHARAARVNSTTLNWELYKRVVGTFTQLGSSISQTIAVGNSYELKLSMVGTTIELYDEGGGSATISATDSAITAAGYSGLRENNTSTNSSRYHIDNFSADDVGGSATDLTIQDATHAHTADSLTVTTSTDLTVQDATHAHAADNLTLTTTGAVDLTIADATHGHSADSPTLTLGYVDLVIDDALHGHTADNLTLSVSGSVDLLIANALHAHFADTPTPSPGYIDLTIADALHAHTADNITLGGLYSDLELILKILSNRQELNAGTGTFTIYDDDSVSVLFTAAAWADAAGTVPYSGGTLGRIDALA